MLRAVFWDVVVFYFQLTFLNRNLLVDCKSEVLLNHIAKKNSHEFFPKGDGADSTFFLNLIISGDLYIVLK